MKNTILISILLLSNLLQAQKVELIKDRQGGTFAHKTIFNNAGDIITAGEFAMVMKMDTNGQEIWRRDFQADSVLKRTDVPTEFTNVAVDSEDNIYLYAEKEPHGIAPYIVKLNTHGDVLWVSDDLPIDPEHERRAGQMFFPFYDSIVRINYLFSEVEMIHRETGALLGVDSTFDDYHIIRIAPEIKVDGLHYVRTSSGFLAFDSTGNYTEIPVGFEYYQSTWHIDSTGFYVYSSVPIDSNGKTIRVPNLFKLDAAGNVLQSKRVITNSNFEDGEEIYIVDVIAHPTKGIVCYGQYIVDKGDLTSNRLGWASQLHPEDFRVLFDTATQIRQNIWGNLLYFNNTIIGQGGAGKSPYYLKLNLKDIDTYPAASVEGKSEAGILKVYPNPSSNGSFRVEAGLAIQEIQVYALTGQMLFAQSLNALSYEFYLKTKGVYILQVETRDGEIQRSKIINQ